MRACLNSGLPEADFNKGKKNSKDSSGEMPVRVN